VSMWQLNQRSCKSFVVKIGWCWSLNGDEITLYHSLLPVYIPDLFDLLGPKSNDLMGA
jgi:hypothetical protein